MTTFDNVKPIDKEAREIALPLGKSIVYFTVRHCDARSASYLRVKHKVSKNYRKLIEADMLSDEKDREIVIRTFLHYVEGWRGVTSGGEPVPYTEDNALALLSQSPKLFYDLASEASEASNFMPGEDDTGN